MIGLYLVFCYFVGFLILADDLKEDGQITVMDVIMFVMSPTVVPTFIIVKCLSHVFTLDKVLLRNDDEEEGPLTDEEIKDIKDEIEKK